MMTDDTTATPEASMGDGGEGAKLRAAGPGRDPQTRHTDVRIVVCDGASAVRESCSGSDDDSSLCQDTLHVMTTRRM